MAAGEPISPDSSTATPSSAVKGERTEAASRTQDHTDAPFSPRSTGQFGHFQVLEMIGHGGMGIVYKARDPQLNRDVAIKQLLAGAAAHPHYRERFATEATAIAALDHPNIIPIYDFELNAGEPYFVMKYLEGGSLSQHRARYIGNARAVATLMAKVARAVQHGHGRRILHRDLKPSNILLDEHGEPLVSDFGLAKLLDAGDDMTYTGAVLGTPAYMAPEQRTGTNRQLGFACDIWSLGITIRELVTGCRGSDTDVASDPTPANADGVSSKPSRASSTPDWRRSLANACNLGQKIAMPRPEPWPTIWRNGCRASFGHRRPKPGSRAAGADFCWPALAACWHWPAARFGGRRAGPSQEEKRTASDGNWRRAEPICCVPMAARAGSRFSSPI